jgi:hypothetical protein
MGGFPDLSELALCYGFRNAPESSGGALAYGITHPTRLLRYFQKSNMIPIYPLRGENDTRFRKYFKSCSTGI